MPLRIFNNFNSQTTKQEITRKLENIKFPVLLSFVLLDSFQIEKLRANGYDEVYDFFLGSTLKINNFTVDAAYGGRFYWEGYNSTVKGLQLQ